MPDRGAALRCGRIALLVLTSAALLGCGGGTPESPPPSEETQAAGTAGGEDPQAEGHYFEDCDRREDARGWLTCVVAVSLRETLPGEEIVEEGPLTLRIGETHRIHLDNLLDQIAQSASEQEAVEHIASFLRGTLENLQPEELRIEQVRATLKPAGWARETSARLGDPALLSRPFGGGAEVVYVQDMPTTMRVLSVADLETLGQSADGLHARALENLAAALTLPEVDLPTEAGRIAVVQLGDSYEAARLLVPSLWEDLAARAQGELVVAVPTRDVLMIVDGRLAEAVTALRAIAQQAYDAGPYPVTPQLFRLTADGFVPLDAEL